MGDSDPFKLFLANPHDDGPSEPASMAESFARVARQRADFVMKHREHYLEAWIAETGLHPSECVLVEATDPGSLRTTIAVRRRDGAEVKPDMSAAFERRKREQEKLERLAHQRSVLRREVRRLNEKVAAMSAVVVAWRSADGWKAVRAMAAKPVIDGPLWDLRKALGLTAAEVSNADVIRAAARKLGKDGAK